MVGWLLVVLADHPIVCLSDYLSDACSTVRPKVRVSNRLSDCPVGCPTICPTVCSFVRFVRSIVRLSVRFVRPTVRLNCRTKLDVRFCPISISHVVRTNSDVRFVRLCLTDCRSTSAVTSDLIAALSTFIEGEAKLSSKGTVTYRLLMICTMLMHLLNHSQPYAMLLAFANKQASPSMD